MTCICTIVPPPFKLKVVLPTSFEYQLVLSNGQCLDNFDVYFWGPTYMSRLTQFRELFCFQEDIRLQSSKLTCMHSQRLHGHAILALGNFKSVWRIQNVLMRIRIPIFKLMRIRIRLRIQVLLLGREILFLQIFNYCFLSLPKLVMSNFSARMREEG